MVGQKETWDLFIQGNHEAFDDLYSQHYLGLINFGVRMTGDREYANECIVEMMLGLWEKRGRLPQVDNVRSYLLTCTKTMILKKIKAEKLRESKEEFAFDQVDQHDISYEDHLTQIQSDNQLKARLSKSLDKLTNRQRELLRLKFFDGLDYDDIALECNISKRTAYNIIHESLKILKEDLKSDGNNQVNNFSSLLYFAFAIIHLKLS